MVAALHPVVVPGSGFILEQAWQCLRAQLVPGGCEQCRGLWPRQLGGQTAFG